MQKEYIERTTAIRLLRGNCIRKYPLTFSMGLVAGADEISQLPAADVVEVVHGFWVEKQIPLNWCEDDVDVVYICSICGNDDIGKCRYCPNCGARMDKEE